MISPKFAELLAIVKSAGSAGISSANIFKQSTENKDSLITDPEMLSKLVFSVRNVNLITTSHTKTSKIHNITDKGIAELLAFTSQEPEKLADNAENEAIAEIYTEEDRYNAAVQAEEELSGIDPEDLFYLDPTNEFENAMIIIASSMREIKAKPPAIKIERKAQKIDTLNRLGALMSDDIKAVFDEIQSDLSMIEGA